jgi:hypothetical protein
MTLEVITKREKVCITLDASTGVSIVPLLTYVPYSQDGYRLIDEYLEIEDLKATSWIYSLQKIAYPVFQLEDTDSKIALAAVNLEWKSARIQLDLLCNINKSGNWQKLSSYSLLNPDPYPYREYQLGNHSLGSNAMIGLQIKNVGYGLLQNGSAGNDRVTVFADLKRTITMEQSVEKSTRLNPTVPRFVPTKIVQSNINRKSMTILNKGNYITYIDIDNQLNSDRYLVNLNPGAYYEVPTPVYKGEYWALNERENAELEIREFS